MKKTTAYLNYISVFIAAILVGLDQFLKQLAVEHLSGIETFPVIEDVFQLTYVENRGAAFGILEGKKLFLVGITGIVLLVLAILLLFQKIKHPFLIWSITLVLGGGVGNLIDRISLGYVIDYLHLTLFDFPVFNFADCCVSIGTVMLIIYFLFLDTKSKNKTGN